MGVWHRVSTKAIEKLLSNQWVRNAAEDGELRQAFCASVVQLMTNKKAMHRCMAFPLHVLLVPAPAAATVVALLISILVSLAVGLLVIIFIAET
jgi:hypothetical protein